MNNLPAGPVNKKLLDAAYDHNGADGVGYTFSAYCLLVKMLDLLNSSGISSLPVDGNSLKTAYMMIDGFIEGEKTKIDGPKPSLVSEAYHQLSCSLWELAEGFADHDKYWYLIIFDFPDEVTEMIKAGKFATIGELFEIAPFEFF